MDQTPTNVIPANVTPPIVVDRVGVQVGNHQLLKDVSISFEGGSLVALVGPNGAGKSTFLSLVAGDREPSSGVLTIDGVAPYRWRPVELARTRAVLTQRHEAAFQFTVTELVELGRVPYPPSELDSKIVDQALADAEVVSLRARDSTTLSGGELARTMFARVLAQTTPIVLLDEPTAALDLRHQERVLRAAARLAEQGCLVLAVLHDLNLAARYADRIAMFANGELVADGPPESILTAQRVEQVYGQAVTLITNPVTGGPLVVPL